MKYHTEYCTLKSRALVGQFTNPIKHKINDFLSDGVVTTSIVIGSIFLSSYELFGMKKLTIGPSSYLVNNGGLEINEYSAGYMFTGTGFREKSIERIVTSAYLNVV